jgi:predicted DNA-binding transcriptional regulator AlpA
MLNVMTHVNTRPPAMVRFKEVCETLGMSTDAGYLHVRAGTFPIPVLKVGGIWKARREDLDAFIAGTPVA